MKILLAKHNITTGKSSCRWEHNIEMYLRKIGWCDMDGIHLAEDRDHWWALVNMVMNLQVP
jgi:hypothetical protein